MQHGMAVLYYDTIHKDGKTRRQETSETELLTKALLGHTRTPTQETLHSAGLILNDLQGGGGGGVALSLTGGMLLPPLVLLVPPPPP